jgi:hypothetical protein
MQEANLQIANAQIVGKPLNSNEIVSKENARNASMLEEETKRAKLTKMSLISPLHLSQTLYRNLHLKRKSALQTYRKTHSSHGLYQLTQFLMWQLSLWLRGQQCYTVKSVKRAMIFHHHLPGGFVYVLTDLKVS